MYSRQTIALLFAGLIVVAIAAGSFYYVAGIGGTQPDGTNALTATAGTTSLETTVHTPPQKTINNTPVTVRVAHSTLTGAAALWVANDLGYFKQANITLEITPTQSSSYVTQALLAGKEDVGFAVSGLDLFTLDAKQPGVFKVFMVGADYSPKTNFSGILVRADSPFKSVQDLKGARFGISSGLITGASTNWVISKYFSPNSITFVTIPVSSLSTALASNQVDAIWVTQPDLNIAVKSGMARVLPNSSLTIIMDPMPVAGLAFTSQFTNEHPQTASRVVQIMDAAVAYMNANPQSALEIVANHAGVPVSELENNNRTPWEYFVQVNATVGNASVESLLQTLADKYHAAGYTANAVNVSNLIYRP
ncbi:NMT1/THI5 like protein [uncultured archaeon]|nr:NMT1/THI5 like protein [uncultured archaeon]